VHVILKLLGGPYELDKEKIALLRSTAVKKCEILRNGFEKRGKNNEAKVYEDIRKCLLAGELPEQSV
jgi:hypothetical protein